jgi:hypothetical protein
VELAVKTLARGGFDMTGVCVVGKDWVPQNEIAFLHTGLRARFFGTYGALWTTLSGILFGTALVCGPAGEHMVILGSLAASMLPTLYGTTPLGGALGALGIPSEAAAFYEKAVAAQKFLIIVRGDAHRVERARELLPHADFETFDSTLN